MAIIDAPVVTLYSFVYLGSSRTILETYHDLANLSTRSPNLFNIETLFDDTDIGIPES